MQAPMRPKGEQRDLDNGLFIRQRDLL